MHPEETVYFGFYLPKEVTGDDDFPLTGGFKAVCRLHKELRSVLPSASLLLFSLALVLENFP